MKRRYHYFIVGAVLIAALILGTFFDLNVSKALLPLNGRYVDVISAFGCGPAYLLFAFFGGYLFGLAVLRKKNRVWEKVIFSLGGILFTFVGCYFFGHEIFSLNGIHIISLRWLGYIISVISCGGMFVLGLFLSKKNKDKAAPWIVFIFGVVSAVGVVLGTQVLKPIFSRPRYRLIIMDPDNVYFQNWFERCLDYKEYLALHPDVSRDQFKSFPSGHSACAMVFAFFLANLSYLNPKFEKLSVPLFYVGSAFLVFMSFIRMIDGAHFLSDVAFGALAVLICGYIGNEFLIFLKKMNLGSIEE